MSKLVFVLIGLFLVIPCAARTIIVDDDNPADFNNIQAAIVDANNGDTIVVQPGTYQGQGNRDISFQGKAITIRSTEPNDSNIVASAIIDCQGTQGDPHRGFYFYNQEDANSIINGITITNGFGPYKNISGNNFSRGGAIHCYYNASPTIKNCIIKSCQARNGGAIECYWSSSPTIQNCIFVDNLADDGIVSYGGAILCELWSHPKISNCLFLRNRVGADHGDGGAIWSRNGGPVVTNCNFIDNKAVESGAVAHMSSSSEYTNCLFWDNRRDSRGYDITNIGTVTIENCFLKFGLNSPSIFNSGTVIDGGGNVSGTPGFVDFPNGNYYLLYNSPCVDAGTNDVAGELTENDLAGKERFVDGNGDSVATVDIGTYEFQEPNGSYILLSSNEFEFTYLDAGHDFEPQVLSIRKVGTQNLYWEINKDCSWLDITPAQGDIPTGEVNDVVLTVDIAGLSNGDYSCELTVFDTNAFNSPQTVYVSLYIRPIQKLIDLANDGDTIVIEPGIYKGKYNRDIDFKGKKITVQSTHPYCLAVVASTIIDCNGTEADPHRGFNFHSGEDANSVLKGFTIKNGYAYNGGGIDCDSSSPTITNCNFVNCSAENWGGGINCYKASPLISDCNFTGNSAREGGAITTRGNCGYACSPVIRNCHIFDNMASDSGGGINSDVLSSPIISNCLITYNYAGYYGGGGISIFQSNPQISNCTIVGNISDVEGGGILHWYEYENGSDVNNCIIWGNSSLFGQITLSSDAEMTINYCDIEYGLADIFVISGILNWGTGNIEEDPVFVTGQLGDYYLSQIAAGQIMNSPCLDMGSELAANLGMGSYTTRTDQVADENVVDIGYHYSIVNIADINGDGRVNAIDYVILASQWGQPPSIPSADISPVGGDNIVDTDDIKEMCENWLWSND